MKADVWVDKFGRVHGEIIKAQRQPKRCSQFSDDEIAAIKQGQMTIRQGYILHKTRKPFDLEGYSGKARETRKRNKKKKLKLHLSQVLGIKIGNL